METGLLYARRPVNYAMRRTASPLEAGPLKVPKHGPSYPTHHTAHFSVGRLDGHLQKFYTYTSVCIKQVCRNRMPNRLEKRGGSSPFSIISHAAVKGAWTTYPTLGLTALASRQARYGTANHDYNPRRHYAPCSQLI
jgi:hypothetical protein